jgi:hypothetical protein
MAIAIGQYWHNLNSGNGAIKWQCYGQNQQRNPMAPVATILMQW